jgi:TonB family protein
MREPERACDSRHRKWRLSRAIPASIDPLSRKIALHRTKPLLIVCPSHRRRRIRATGRRAHSILKPFCTVAALAVFAACTFTHAMADEPPATVPACAFGEPPPYNADIDPVSRAVFMKLCAQFNGALVNERALGAEEHSTFKPPGKFIGPAPLDFYPPESRRRNEAGKTFLGVVVETDGRISRAALLKSAGYPALDKAALTWISHVSFESPAYLDSVPVRSYRVVVVQFYVN